MSGAHHKQQHLSGGSRHARKGEPPWGLGQYRGLNNYQYYNILGSTIAYWAPKPYSNYEGPIYSFGKSREARVYGLKGYMSRFLGDTKLDLEVCLLQGFGHVLGMSGRPQILFRRPGPNPPNLNFGNPNDKPQNHSLPEALNLPIFGSTIP